MMLHAGGAGQGGWPRHRPRAHRAVHDQGPVRGRRRPVADQYPAPDQALVPGEERVYNADDRLRDLQLRQRYADEPACAAREIEARYGWKVRVVDLRWLVPLNHAAIARHAGESRRIWWWTKAASAPVSARRDHRDHRSRLSFGGKPLRRVVGADTYTPLAGAAFPGDPEGRGHRRRGRRAGGLISAPARRAVGGQRAMPSAWSGPGSRPPAGSTARHAPAAADTTMPMPRPPATTSLPDAGAGWTSRAAWPRGSGCARRSPAPFFTLKARRRSSSCYGVHCDDCSVSNRGRPCARSAAFQQAGASASTRARHRADPQGGCGPPSPPCRVRPPPSPALANLLCCACRGA